MQYTTQIIESPSRSKQAGPCWWTIAGEYAKDRAVSYDAEQGTILPVKGKTVVRRATRTGLDRAEHQVTVTGDPADVVTYSLSSPQPLVVRITGVTETTA
jgi:hypothetical protein